MTHYLHCFTINRLRLAVRLGYEAPERRTPQPVEADIRLYFADAPACVGDDHGSFIDYAGVCSRVSDAVARDEFHLLEYLTGTLFRTVRSYVDSKGGAEVKIWLRLTKCAAPVPYLEGGASFVMTDLPANATIVDAR
jgi:FolB domain-containing protein